jgi:hypothetical protein
MQRPLKGRGVGTGLEVANVEAEPPQFQFGCCREELPSGRGWCLA